MRAKTLIPLVLLVVLLFVAGCNRECECSTQSPARDIPAPVQPASTEFEPRFSKAELSQMRKEMNALKEQVPSREEIEKQLKELGEDIETQRQLLKQKPMPIKGIYDDSVLFMPTEQPSKK